MVINKEKFAVFRGLVIKKNSSKYFLQSCFKMCNEPKTFSRPFSRGAVCENVNVKVSVSLQLENEHVGVNDVSYRLNMNISE